MRSLPCWNCSSRRLLILPFFFLLIIFLLIYFFAVVLFKISSSQGSAWAPCGPEAVYSRTLPLSVWCAANKHNAVLHQALGVAKLVIGCIVDTNDLCLSITLRVPGKAPHVQSQGMVLFIASSNSDCVCIEGQSSYWQRALLSTSCFRAFS